ncbi:hypothetical protein FRC07_000674 [Ceratobasidium sp. 392]|nr:hypothetical protein FRC07_000674 [Ceratobasidium sp. 392]
MANIPAVLAGEVEILLAHVKLVLILFASTEPAKRRTEPVLVEVMPGVTVPAGGVTRPPLASAYGAPRGWYWYRMTRWHTGGGLWLRVAHKVGGLVRKSVEHLGVAVEQVHADGARVDGLVVDVEAVGPDDGTIVPTRSSIEAGITRDGRTRKE